MPKPACAVVGLAGCRWYSPQAQPTSGATGSSKTRSFTPFHPGRGRQPDIDLPPSPEPRSGEPGADKAPSSAGSVSPRAQISAGTASAASSTAASQQDEGTDGWRRIARAAGDSGLFPSNQFREAPKTVDGPAPFDATFRSEQSLRGAAGSLTPTPRSPAAANKLSMEAADARRRFSPDALGSGSSFTVYSGDLKPRDVEHQQGKQQVETARADGAAFAGAAAAARSISVPATTPITSRSTGGEIIAMGVAAFVGLFGLFAFVFWEADTTPTQIVAVTVDGTGIRLRDAVPSELRSLTAAAAAAASSGTASSPEAPATSPAPAVSYADVEAQIFEHLDAEYEALGFVAKDEVAVTVADHAFTQYGIVTPAGVKRLLTTVLQPALGSNDVFVDIGSGIGNVVLQALIDTPCNTAVGVELLPSRMKEARYAYLRASSQVIPDAFDGKRAAWIEGDVIAQSAELAKLNPTVVFTHSWMFDDDLMAKLGNALAGMSSLRCVVTSRPVPQFDADPQHWLRSESSLEADWNPASPFFVYSRCDGH